MIVLVASTAWGWGTVYVGITSNANNQEILAIEADRYAHVRQVYMKNDGSTTVTASVHFEGTAGKYNRISPPVKLAAGEGVVLDFAGINIVGPIGKDIDIDTNAATTTLHVFVVYVSLTKPNR